MALRATRVLRGVIDGALVDQWPGVALVVLDR
jgi:hypothetical protein